MAYLLRHRPKLTWPRELNTLPGTLSFSQWQGATYFGLDRNLAAVTENNQTLSLLGYRDVGKGRVWFVGFNLLYYLNQNGQQAAVTNLTDYMLNSVEVSRSVVLPEVQAEIIERSPTHLMLHYTSQKPVSAVVCMTYFPRWQAAIDGAATTIADHEHLMFIQLPAGTHTLTLHYDPFGTSVARIGLLLSALGLVLVIASVVWLKRRPPLATADRLTAFDDRLPPIPAVTEIGYAPCPNCDFGGAIVGPPTDRSYPFNSLECPVCGFSLGSGSFLAGEPPQEAMKRQIESPAQQSGPGASAPRPIDFDALFEGLKSPSPTPSSLPSWEIPKAAVLKRLEAKRKARADSKAP